MDGLLLEETDCSQYTHAHFFHCFFLSGLRWVVDRDASFVQRAEWESFVH